MRPIDGDALVKYCNGNPFITDSVKTYIRLSVATMPTIEERKTGKWIHQTKFGRIECDQCGKVYRNAFTPKNYCPNCGARLVQEGEDNDG